MAGTLWPFRIVDSHPAASLLLLLLRLQVFRQGGHAHVHRAGEGLHLLQAVFNWQEGQVTVTSNPGRVAL